MKNDLINGKPVKSIILFALPIMLSSMLQYNYNLVADLLVPMHLPQSVMLVR